MQEYIEATRAAGRVVNTAIVMAAAVGIARARNWSVAKFKIRQFSLENDSPNLMLAKFSCYTVHVLYTIHCSNLSLQTIVATMSVMTCTCSLVAGTQHLSAMSW